MCALAAVGVSTELQMCASVNHWSIRLGVRNQRQATLSSCQGLSMPIRQG
jgi:hypothetical protein